MTARTLNVDNDLELKNTHPALLTKEDSLGPIETHESNGPNRSVLGDIVNVSPAGILINRGITKKDKYKVTWEGIVSGGTVPSRE